MRSWPWGNWAGFTCVNFSLWWLLKGFGPCPGRGGFLPGVGPSQPPLPAACCQLLFRTLAPAPQPLIIYSSQEIKVLENREASVLLPASYSPWVGLSY